MRQDALDAACRRGVAAGAFPGAVVLAGNGAGILVHRAYGHRALAPERLPMLPDTVFDLSSLTKPMATTTAMMLLVRDGRVRLDDPACTVIPELGAGARAAVTFRQLLNHTSGLPAWKPYYETVVPASLSVLPAKQAVSKLPRERDTEHVIPAKAGIQGRVHDEELVAPPGQTHLYSDLGFMLLGEAIERLSGRPLDRFCQDEIFAPLGLASTFFVDLSGSAPAPRPGAHAIDATRRGAAHATAATHAMEPHPAAAHAIAATEDCPWRRKILRGEVHDDNAFAMGGVAGHAGLFSSAPDVHRFLRFLGRCHADAEPDFLPGAVVREFLDAERTLPGQTHVLGWDTPSPEGSSSGRHFSARTVGHLGFTGTSIWWDLARDVHVVFLTNRVHPSRDNAAIREYRPLVHDAVMEGLCS